MALRVLVVDDDAGIRETLARLLRAKGCEVSTATDGSDALRILRGEEPKPNAIVLDLMMPVMGGWEFLEAKADDATIRAIPVFVTTAHAQMAVELPEARRHSQTDCGRRANDRGGGASSSSSGWRWVSLRGT